MYQISLDSKGAGAYNLLELNKNGIKIFHRI